MVYSFNMEKLKTQESLKVGIFLAVPEDARSIREVQYKTWLTTYPNEEAGVTVDDVEDRYKDAFTDENIQKRQKRILDKTENENYFVAKVDGKVVGFCFVTKNEEKNQLSAIYILPEFQGQGLGKRLWDSASAFIDTSKDTFVEVVTYNTQAIEFYKRLGFVDTGRRWSNETFKMKSGALLPEMEMVIEAK